MDPNEETAQQQVDRLARFILEHVPGEPSRSEGAVDTAIRLLSLRYGSPSGWKGLTGDPSVQAIADAVAEATANPGRTVTVKGDEA